MVFLQVVSGVLPAELSLIQDQLQVLGLNQNLSELQRYTWGSEGETHDDLVV